ncbi:MAG: c-type cytochrome biogenesis protein CcmI, partial [Methylococcaceae bacterium]|nr:c-type cytochrome biogenesis protein CcmI [Methylococcaceae bacterium]
AGDFNAAVTYWTKLQQHYKPDERAYQEVQQLLDQANAKLGKATAARAAAQEPATEKAVSDLSGSVNVKVELGDAFKGKANPEDFVFIYAQALVGPKAPLAVVKKQVKDLPISVVLDDSMAMIPGMNVSSMENIKITARISATGTATAQPGEAFGAIEIMGMNRSGVKAIVINDTIK